MKLLKFCDIVGLFNSVACAKYLYMVIHKKRKYC